MNGDRPWPTRMDSYHTHESYFYPYRVEETVAQRFQACAHSHSIYRAAASSLASRGVRLHNPRPQAQTAAVESTGCKPKGTDSDKRGSQQEQLNASEIFSCDTSLSREITCFFAWA